ncbi:MAG TPA: ABC transporter substrate-binding protein [Actinomycetota bacterium]
MRKPLGTLALALLASACATTATGGTSAGDTGTFPVTVTAANGEVTLDARPAAVVSLSATATEILFAIGAGDQVVAVDDQSNYPPEAPLTDLSAYTPSVEAIAGYEPDLVVYSDDLNDLAAGLEAVELPAVQQPAAATLGDTYEQIEELGALTGHVGEAATLIGEMRSDVDELVAGLPERTEPLTYYHELDQTYYSVTSSTFIGQVYSLLGLTSIADAADKAGTGYPQLSAEAIVAADPDLIFLADTKCCDQNAETVAARDGWDGIAAVENGAVVELDDDVASRWGPRVVDFMRTVAAALEEIAA